MCNRSTTAFLMEHVKLTHNWPLFPFITSENIGKSLVSGVFRGCKMGQLARNQLNIFFKLNVFI